MIIRFFKLLILLGKLAKGSSRRAGKDISSRKMRNIKREGEHWPEDKIEEFLYRYIHDKTFRQIVKAALEINAGVRQPNWNKNGVKDIWQNRVQ